MERTLEFRRSESTLIKNSLQITKMRRRGGGGRGQTTRSTGAGIIIYSETGRGRYFNLLQLNNK